jgi:hypothetical protein
MPLADVPGLSAEEMKRKFEEIVRDVVITAFNQNMQLLEDAVFVDPQSHSYYLRASDLLTTYQSILDNGDAGKIAAAVAVKEMDTSLKNSMSTTSGKVTTLEGKMTTVEGKVTTLEGKVATLETLETQGWIVFDKNDGTDIPDKKSVKCTFNYTANTAVIPSTAPTFTRTGYTFLGWAEARSAETAEYQAGDTISNLDQHSYGNMVCLNAVWQENTP